MPDLGANQMYYNASVSGTIDTMPDIPGLAVCTTVTWACTSVTVM